MMTFLVAVGLHLKWLNRSSISVCIWSWNCIILEKSVYLKLKMSNVLIHELHFLFFFLQSLSRKQTILVTLTQKVFFLSQTQGHLFAVLQEHCFHSGCKNFAFWKQKIAVPCNVHGSWNQNTCISCPWLHLKSLWFYQSTNFIIKCKYTFHVILTLVESMKMQRYHSVQVPSVHNSHHKKELHLVQYTNHKLSQQTHFFKDFLNNLEPRN